MLKRDPQVFNSNNKGVIAGDDKKAVQTLHPLPSNDFKGPTSQIFHKKTIKK